MADTKLSALTELAATPADADEVYIRDVSEAAAAESKRITVANLIAGAGGGTKEFFFQAVTDDSSPSPEMWNDWGGASAGSATQFVVTTFKVPHDFSAIVNAELLVFPGSTTGTANHDIFSLYCAVGEAYNTHSESDTATTYNWVSSQLFAIDVSGILSSLSADDYVSIKSLYPSGGNYTYLVLGVRFKYS